METEKEMGLFKRSAEAIIMSLGSLPMSFRSKVGSTIGKIVSCIPTRDQKIAKLQLQWLLRDGKEVQHLRGAYSSICQTIFETLNLFPILRQKDQRIECDDLELLLELQRNEKPSIFLSAHLGNWDLLAAYAVDHGFDVYAVGVPAQKAFLHSLLAKLRAKYGIKTIWRQRGSAKTIMKILEGGGNVAALIDQDTRVKSIPINFLGVEANTPVVLVQMARELDANLLTAFLVRTSPKTYRVEARVLDASKSDEEVLASYNKHLEELIRQYPDQWVWFHKRWRTMPDGTRLSSKEYLAYLTEKCQP